MPQGAENPNHPRWESNRKAVEVCYIRMPSTYSPALN